jgi:N-acetylneuraminate 9-O-acetyltransferase
MQVMFLLYHYFEAREVYNGIRVLIAGYVWMTGYGNFHYYYRSNDYCIGRFAQMMWRLNFLVIMCCIVLRNHYMLYYICPMHTLFTVLVYAALGIGSHMNSSTWGMMLKLAGCVALVLTVWDLPGVFHTIWSPFAMIVGYQDPRRPAGDIMHGVLSLSGCHRTLRCAYLLQLAAESVDGLIF